MAGNSFFDETSDQSLVKATIVSKYFWAWAKVIIPTAKKQDGKIAYIDVFAGPGRYRDARPSTPIMVLEKAIEDRDMREMLVTIFNDKDETHCRALQQAIDQLPGIETLRYRPEVHNGQVGDEIVSIFEDMSLVPTLFFVDPWGYKGLSLRLVNSVLKDWGCDCIFFFNYNRINMGLNNRAVEEHMNALFGKERADELREKLPSLSPSEREVTIVEEICQALHATGGEFVLPFCFKTRTGRRTSHHLIFVSKHFRGYEIMKEIMAKESSESNQGVPSFAYSPAGRRQPFLFEFCRPLTDLEDMLLRDFGGQTLTRRRIYELHSVGRAYIKQNYRQVLMKLEGLGKVTADPPADRRRKGTFAEHVRVTFLEKT